MSAQRKSGGFTLVELLVVITIIAILSVIGITIFSGVQKSARDANRISSINAIAKAMEVHYHGETGEYECVQDQFFANGNQAYKDPLTGNNYDIPGCGAANLGSVQKTCAFASVPWPCYSSWNACATLEQANSGNHITPCAAGTCLFCLKNQQ